MSREVDAISEAAAAKHYASLLRDARAVQRRLDKLSIDPAEDAVATRLLAEARDAVERLIAHLARQELGHQRRVKEAIRRR